MLATGITFLASAPASGAIHNIFPADHNGFPTDRFFTNEALFGTFTSDMEGGRVCVVGAGVTDPTTRTCDNPAWGSPNTYVGLGTFLGYPLEPSAKLVPGEWRLLTDHKPPDQDEYEGLSLSEVFRVLPCQGECSTSVSQQHFQAWKDRAESLQNGHHGVCKAATVADTLNQINSVSSAYSAARGMYALAGGGLAAMMLGGAWGALDYMMGELNTEEKAMAILRTLSCDVAQMYQDIVDDPPDFNYDTIAEPEFLDLPVTGDQVWDDYLDTLMQVEAYGKASRIAYERFQGAQIDDVPEAAAAQAKAASDFTFALNEQLRRLEPLQTEVGALPWMAEGPVTTSEDLDEALDVRALIHTEGHSAEEHQQLLDLGLSEDTITEIEQEYGEPGLEDIDLSYSLGEQLTDTSELIADTVVDYDMFGRELAVISSEYEKRIPAPVPNRAPVSSFTASAITGEAPLTVEFTSTAYDADGDDLSLTWDIAGVLKIEDQETINHTFEAPGNYGISLVADDGEEWHQAVMWVSVYPPGSDADDNQPPVARFTPTIVNEEGPVTVTFESLSFDPDGDEITHTWHFGDGVQMTGEQVTRTFDAGFIYSVLLVVSDGHLTGQAAGEVTSDHPGSPPIDNEPPVASFDANPTTGTAPLEVEFTSTSTDPDGDELQHTWYFGDGTTAEGDTATHLYPYVGTYTATLVVSDGQASTLATQQIVVNPVPKDMTAAFSVSHGYDVAKLVNGARIFSVSSEQNTTNAAGSNAVAPTSNWWNTATGDVTDQSMVLHLAGDGRDLLDQLVITGSTASTSPRTISLELSDADTPLGDYRTVIDRTELAQQAEPQAIDIAPQTARFARITLHDNWGGNSMRLREIGLTTVERDGGLVSLPDGPPAYVSDTSSTFGNSSGNVLLPSSSNWRTANGQTADQYVNIDLGGEGSHNVDSLTLRGTTQTSSVREFELFLSEDGSMWQSATSGELPADGKLHTFSFTTQSAQHARLEIASNHGGSHVTLTELRLETEHGLNVADGRGVGATVVSYSTRQGTGATYSPDNPLEVSTSSTWRSAAGEHTDQHLTVLLRNGQVETIDRVMLTATAANSRPRTVEIWTSDSEDEPADYALAATRTLLDSNSEQWITFDPVPARFVQLRIVDSYSSNYVSLNQFRIYATSRGGADTVPFVDLSTPGDYDIASWEWNFGYPGATSTLQHPIHTFPGPGTYSVTLTVTDANGAGRTYEDVYTVAQPPQFSVTTHNGQTTVNEGVLVYFDAVHEAGVGIVEWAWDLDFTTTNSTGTRITGRFPDQGEYVISARGLTADGIWTAPQTLNLTVVNVPPSLSWRGAEGYALDPITPGAFSSLTDVAADMPLLCTIDWGDGQSTTHDECDMSVLRANGHPYAQAGNYTVTITADDRDGGVTTDTATYTAFHRPALAQITQVTTDADHMEVTARLLDQFTGSPISGALLAISGDGGTPVAESTDADGIVTVEVAAGIDQLEVVYTGSNVYEPTHLARAADAPAADIVFILDESNSTSTYISRLVQNLELITGNLGAHLDYHVGLISLRGGLPELEDHAFIQSPATNDLSTFIPALADRTVHGGSVNGHAGVVRAGSADMELRESAATCFVLLSDATANEISTENTPNLFKDHAVAAAQEHGAAVFSITGSQQDVLDEFGLGNGLAGQTGGDWWDIRGFSAASAGEVLDALATQCVTLAHTPDVSVTKASDADLVGPGDEVEYTLTVRNEAAITVDSVDLVDTLPSGVEVVSVSDGGQHANGEVTWPALQLAAADEATRTVTVRMPTAVTVAGDYDVVNRAAVTIPVEYGPESDEDNNTTQHTLTLRVDEDDVPDMEDVGLTRDLFVPTGVESGDEFDYSLTVTNHGDTTASGIAIHDLIPARFEVLAINAPDWTNPAGADLVTPDTNVPGASALSLELDQLDPNDSATATVTLRVLPLSQPPVVTDTGSLTADLPDIVAAPADEVTWQACVSAARDDNPTNDCADAAVTMRDVVAQLTVRLAGGATFLIASVQTTSALADDPVDLEWLPGVGAPGTAVDPSQVAFTDLERGVNHIFTWPGVATDATDTVVDWPGWRLLTDQDYDANGVVIHPVTGAPMTPVQVGNLVHGNYLLDATEPDYAWRSPSDVIVSANPQAQFTVEYREQLPAVPLLPEEPGTPTGPGTPVVTEPPATAGPVDSPSATDPARSATTAADQDRLATTGGTPGIIMLIGAMLLASFGLLLLQRREQHDLD